jgi:anti-sigma B factor antagonist
MEIEKKQTNSSLSVALSGRLDTVTAPELEKALDDIDDIQELRFDLAALDYISSAGLRELLTLHKKMASRKGMKIKNVTPSVMDIFNLAGFTKFLTIEN